MRPYNVTTPAAKKSASRQSAQGFELESLEGRKLFAVSVSQGYPGFYEVVGDESADHIDISVSMKDHTFTLDNVTYTDVAYISVQGSGGSDTINVLSVDGRGDIS